MVATSSEQLDLLRSLSRTERVDFWSQPRRVGMDVDVMVSPDEQLAFVSTLDKYGLQHEVLIEDVQRFTFHILQLIYSISTGLQ